jgi:hypothetical protein
MSKLRTIRTRALRRLFIGLEATANASGIEAMPNSGVEPYIEEAAERSRHRSFQWTTMQ